MEGIPVSYPWTVASDDQIYASSGWISTLLVLKGWHYRLATFPFMLLGQRGHAPG